MNLNYVLRQKDRENSVYSLRVGNGRTIGMTIGDEGRLKQMWEFAEENYPKMKKAFYHEFFVNFAVDCNGKQVNFI